MNPEVTPCPTPTPSPEPTTSATPGAPRPADRSPSSEALPSTATPGPSTSPSSLTSASDSASRPTTPREFPPLPKRRIYVASSWRNPDQPEVVDRLRARGFEVYDFHNPPGRAGFSWSEIDPWWQSWTAEEYVAALEHPLAVAGYASDFAAMQWADTVVLVLPCGRSAHLELGWAVGAGKRTVIITRDGEEPELMAKMVDHIAVGLDDAIDFLGHPSICTFCEQERDDLSIGSDGLTKACQDCIGSGEVSRG